MSSAKNNNHLYADKWTRIDTLLGDISFLARLTRARDDFVSDGTPYEVTAFLKWLSDTYGVVAAIRDGNIAAEYQVVDEQKFLMFLMKYS